MTSPLLVVTVIRSAETRSLVRIVLEGAGHRVIESDGYPQAQPFLSDGLNPDLVLVESISTCPSDKLQYLQLLGSARKQSICVITGMADQRLRNEASSLGIRLFLMKPVTRGDIEVMVDKLSAPVLPESKANISLHSAGTEALMTSNPADTPAVPILDELGDNRFFLAAAPSMLEIHRQAKLLADVNVTVLILGESGTGKEVIAHLIHKYSRRSRQKFLSMNCAALPADLLESELFGHRQGAFTGAIKDRAGWFEQADGGTLLLDEIGEISSRMQAKLLHVLQDGQFTRLGGQGATRVDVRVLAATNVQIENALLDKTFREDLYYRLSTFTIHVPPLRERRVEIPYLIEETIRRTPVEMKSGSECSFPSRLIDAALGYDWPGNLRELRNFVTWIIVMRDSDAGVRQLEMKIAAKSAATQGHVSDKAPSHGSGVRSIMHDAKKRVEAQVIQEALDAVGWNRRHAAQHLNISYRSLLYKIKEHSLTHGMPTRLRETFRTTYSARENVA